MSQTYVTKDGRCMCCGSKMIKCDMCPRYFLPTDDRHVSCGDKCRKRKSRKKNTRYLPSRSINVLIIGADDLADRRHY